MQLLKENVLFMLLQCINLICAFNIRPTYLIYNIVLYILNTSIVYIFILIIYLLFIN